MTFKQVFTKGKVPVKVWTDDIDSKTIDQLVNCSQMPFIHKHIAAMPDVHLGIGATVGSVIPTKSAIIPAAVGVDIGCGMCAVRTSLTANDLPDNLAPVRVAIENAIPLGPGAKHPYRLSEKSKPIQPTWNMLHKKFSQELSPIRDKHPALFKQMKNSEETWRQQLGTLGSGNHFIEICLDEVDNVWIVLHSGSRGIGNNIGRYFISLAKRDMEIHHISLPDMDLAYLSEGTQWFDDYVEAVSWAQSYAKSNRDFMMELILLALANTDGFPSFETNLEVINCHHNYIEQEHHYGSNVWVTRKGAIRAREGDLGIIPGSMGAKSYIVRGKGNPESFHSCSHGAGRQMSRKKAKEAFTEADLIKQTEGIECRKDAGVLDEIPGAYKDIDVVMDNQKDLVDIVHTLRQIVNVKG